MNLGAESAERLWVVPVNDLEALEIRDLLGSQGEIVLVSRQSWGATWSGLEPPVRAAIEQFRRRCPDGRVFGVELDGANPFGAVDIDHHRYSGGDRSSPLSSLEQIAAMLGVELDRRRQLVAANDRGYIPAMLAAGASSREVAAIRAADRAAQGLTRTDEAHAAGDIRERAEWRGRRVLVRCPHGPTSAHSDRLFGLADEVLLAGPRRWSYSGPRHTAFAAMRLPEHHWSGGVPNSGYFGIESPSPGTQALLLQVFWE